jgi:hypothetical protein
MPYPSHKRPDRDSKARTSDRREEAFVTEAGVSGMKFGKWLRSKYGETVADRHEGVNKDGSSKGGKR